MSFAFVPGRSRLNRIGNALLYLIAWAVPMLPVVAAASPCDPLWISGFYDADDGDDVVTSVSDSTATPHGDVYDLRSLQPLAYKTWQCEFRRYTSQWSLPDERGPPHAVQGLIRDSALVKRSSPCLHRPHTPDALVAFFTTVFLSSPSPAVGRGAHSAADTADAVRRSIPGSVGLPAPAAAGLCARSRRRCSRRRPGDPLSNACSRRRRRPLRLCCRSP